MHCHTAVVVYWCNVQTWPVLRKSSKFCSDVFMTAPIHVLRSNFTQIVRLEVGETMRCFADKNVRRMLFRRHFAPIRQKAPKVCREACHVTLRLLVPICRRYSRKSDFVRSQYMRSLHNEICWFCCCISC